MKPIKGWTEAEAKSSSIASIAVVNRSPNATPENVDLLKATLEKVAPFAHGPNKFDLQVSLDNYKVPGGVATALGDVSEIAGEVKIIDPTTKAVAADYYTQEKRKSGQLAAAAGANSASDMAIAFGARLCTQVILHPK